MIKVNYIATKTERSGRSVYEEEIQKRLKNVKLIKIDYIPCKTKGISLFLKAVKRFLWLPYQIKAKANKNSLTHLTSEDFAYLLNFMKFKKTVITCHDLAPLIYRPNSLFLKLNITGLKKADRIITVSNFSKKEIIKYLNYPEDKIAVINDAVDHNQYYLKRSKEILKKYNIPEDEKVILYVGSERKRQNLPFLIESFYQLKKKLPKVKLLKVGASQQPKEKLSKLIKKLGLEKEIIFTGFVDEKELVKIYNSADLFVYPCLYAGFGIPPLEAMACGTPVIISNSTSLPEVVGNAGIMIDPYNKDQMTEAMFKVLTDKELRKNLIRKGLERAKTFSWEKAAQETLKVYSSLQLD